MQSWLMNFCFRLTDNHTWLKHMKKANPESNIKSMIAFPSFNDMDFERCTQLDLKLHGAFDLSERICT